MGITDIDNSTTSVLDVRTPSQAESMNSVGVKSKYRALYVIWRNRRTIWRFLLIFAASSTLLAFLLPSEYTSTATIMPDNSSSGLGLTLFAHSGSVGAGSGSVIGDLLGAESPTAVSVAILRSRTVADALISKFDLLRVYGYSQMYKARKKLTSRTTISDDRKSTTITISVEDRNPERAAQLTNEYITQLVRLVTHLDTSSAHRERVFLGDRLAEVQKQLQQSSTDFSTFASKNTALDVPAEGRAMVTAATRLQGELIAAQSELEAQQQIYGPENVRVKSSQAKIAELQKELQALVGNTGSTRGNGAVASIPDIKQLPILGKEYANLYRNVVLEESIYEALTKQYELAKVEEAGEAPGVKIVDPPNIPERRSAPKRLLIVGLGSLLGVLLGIAWVFAADGWQRLERNDPRRLIVEEAFASSPRWLDRALRKR